MFIHGSRGWLSFLCGLLHSIFVMLFLGLGLANALIQITWLDMRADLGAIIPVFCLFAIVLYCLNYYFELDSYLFWEKRWFSRLVIPVSLLIIVMVHRFDWERLMIVPAATLRDGLGWKGMPLTAVNGLLLGMLLAGFILNTIYKKETRQRRRAMNKGQRNALWLVLIPIFLYLILYFVQPGVRYFFNDAAGILASADIEAFREYLLSFGIWAPILSALLMIFQSVLAPLPAFVITFANGMIFGAFWGGLLSWSSAMLGAGLCYLIARASGRPVVERLVSKTALEWTDRFFDRYGKHSILLARLLPIVSFDIVSYGAGLTSMRFWGFWAATGIGQAPATILYSYLGQTASGSVKILFWVFIVVICLGILVAAWKKRSSFIQLKDPNHHSV